MSPEKKEKIIELLKQGLKQKEIAEITGFSMSVVSAIGCKNGLRRFETARSWQEKHKYITTKTCPHCKRVI